MTFSFYMFLKSLFSFLKNGPGFSLRNRRDRLHGFMQLAHSAGAWENSYGSPGAFSTNSTLPGVHF
jgi:hypothetical protein